MHNAKSIIRPCNIAFFLADSFFFRCQNNLFVWKYLLLVTLYHEHEILFFWLFASITFSPHTLLRYQFAESASPTSTSPCSKLPDSCACSRPPDSCACTQNTGQGHFRASWHPRCKRSGMKVTLTKPHPRTGFIPYITFRHTICRQPRG